MNIIRYMERLKRMDGMIRRKSTGSPDEFARRMGLSKSSLMEYLKLLKELDAPLVYDADLKSYYYLFECELKIGFESKNLTDEELMKINKKELKKICELTLVQK